MLAARRRWTRLLALPVMAVWLAGLLAPLVLAHGQPDLDCGEGAWLSDHHQTAFEDVRPPLSGGHCELCHLLRALRGLAAESRRSVVLADEIASRENTTALLVVRSVRLGPSRAPPIVPA